jgi:hypothetical protein
MSIKKPSQSREGIIVLAYYDGNLFDLTGQIKGDVFVENIIPQKGKFGQVKAYYFFITLFSYLERTFYRTRLDSEGSL